MKDVMERIKDAVELYRVLMERAKVAAANLNERTAVIIQAPTGRYYLAMGSAHRQEMRTKREAFNECSLHRPEILISSYADKAMLIAFIAHAGLCTGANGANTAGCKSIA
jgi:hypothetical protein